MHRMWFEKWLDQALLVGVILVAVATLSPAQTDSSKTPSGQAPTLLPSHDQTQVPDEFFVLETLHKVFTGFHQVDTVRLNQKFPIGESDDVGEVFLFNPHFMITDSGKVMQLSDTLYNPAVRVRVTVGDSVVQESWAFHFSSAPHFRRNDMFGFRLLDFKVKDRFVRVEAPKPLVQPPSTDSTAKRQ